MVSFRDLDVQSLNCKYCKNKEDFVIVYRGTVVVSAYKDSTPDYEEPNETIREIICTKCGRGLVPEYFIGKGGDIMRKHKISSSLLLEKYSGGRKGTLEADSTRYTAWAYRVHDFTLGTLGRVEDGWLVVCGLNRKSHLFQAAGLLHWTYVGEKFGLNQTDAESMAYVIGDLIGRPTVPYETEE